MDITMGLYTYVRIWLPVLELLYNILSAQTKQTGTLACVRIYSLPALESISIVEMQHLIVAALNRRRRLRIIPDKRL